MKAAEVFKMNFGSIYVDFLEPINLTQTVSDMQAANPKFDPFSKKEDRLACNNKLGNQIVFTLQQNIRIMPCTLVATILLLYRKGISEAEMNQKIKWLGNALLQRGIVVSDDTGMPSQTTTNIGLKQLEGQIVRRRDIMMPKVCVGEDQNNDYSNIMLLGYYRNALNYVFFNESIIVCALFSFGAEEVWREGTTTDELFERACFLSELIKREEVIQRRITKKDRKYFDDLVAFMIGQKLLASKTGSKGQLTLTLKSSGEAGIMLIGSICWPMIDTYFIALITALTMVKKKDLDEARFMRECQFIGETLHSDGKVQYYESCNQPSITNAKAALIQMKVFTKRSNYLSLGPDYSGKEGEKNLLKLIEELGQYRMKPTSSSVFDLAKESRDLRRQVLHDFPTMAKL